MSTKPALYLSYCYTPIATYKILEPDLGILCNGNYATCWIWLKFYVGHRGIIEAVFQMVIKYLLKCE